MERSPSDAALLAAVGTGITMRRDLTS